MKIYARNILKVNLHLGKWKKIQTLDSQHYFFNRYIFKIDSIINSIVQITIFLNVLLKSKNRLLFLGGNPYTIELIEDLAISNQQYFLKPWNYGLYTNTKLYKIFSKESKHFWLFKPSAVLIIDPTSVDSYFKEINPFKVPTISFYNNKSTYFIQNSFVTFNTVKFYVKFLRIFFKKKKYTFNFYNFKLKKVKLLKKFKKIKSKKKIFLNKIRFIRVKMIRKNWFLPYWKKQILRNYAKKNQTRKKYKKKI